jgi:phage tail-like protein
MPVFNPVPAFDFNVFLMDDRPPSASSIVGAAVGVASAFITGTFSEVAGLNAELEMEDHREGGRNQGPRKFFKWGRYPNLVLKRGVTPNPDLWDWYNALLYRDKDPVRKNGVILLTDRGSGVSSLFGGPTPLGLPGLDRLPVAAWYFSRAYPERLLGPQLNARSNEIAIETLELAHEGLYRLGPSMLPGAIGDVAASVGI